MEEKIPQYFLHAVKLLDGVFITLFDVTIESKSVIRTGSCKNYPFGKSIIVLKINPKIPIEFEGDLTLNLTSGMAMDMCGPFGPLIAKEFLVSTLKLLDEFK